MLDMRDRAAAISARPPYNKVRAEALASIPSLDTFLSDACLDADDPAALGEMLKRWSTGYDRLPLPGSGQTLARWRALAAVAARDLGLVKLFEGHTDALAILAELDAPQCLRGSRWGVWAAEAPDARVLQHTPLADASTAAAAARKHGARARSAVSHALVTAWLDDEPVLAAVAMDQPSISITRRSGKRSACRRPPAPTCTFDETRADAGRRAARLCAPAGLLAGRRRHCRVLVRRRCAKSAGRCAKRCSNAPTRIGSRTSARSMSRWRARPRVLRETAAHDRRESRRRLQREAHARAAHGRGGGRRGDGARDPRARRGAALPRRALCPGAGGSAGVPAAEPCRTRSRRARRS